MKASCLIGDVFNTSAFRCLYEPVRRQQNSLRGRLKFLIKGSLIRNQSSNVLILKFSMRINLINAEDHIRTLFILMSIRLAKNKNYKSVKILYCTT